MSKDRQSESVDQGGASKPAEEKRDGEFAGNGRDKGGDSSPDETSSSGNDAPIDLDPARERAS